MGKLEVIFATISALSLFFYSNCKTYQLNFFYWRFNFDLKTQSFNERLILLALFYFLYLHPFIFSKIMGTILISNQIEKFYDDDELL